MVFVLYSILYLIASESCEYQFNLKMVVDDEGNDVGPPNTKEIESLDECKKVCDESIECNSFAFCVDAEDTCILKDKILKGSEPSSYNDRCTTYYRTCNGKRNKRNII